MGTASNEQALRPSTPEDRLRLVIDTIPALVLSGDSEGSVDFMNRRWLEFTGRTFEELQGWGWRTVLHPDDIERYSAELRAALSSGAPFETSARLRRADGEYRAFRILNAPLRNEAGTIAKWYVSGIDITEQQRLAHDLQRHRDYLEEAQRLSHTGSFGWRVSTGELFWSQETFRIFECDSTTRPSVDLVLQRVHPDDVATVREHLDRASQDGGFDFEHRLLMPDGSIKHVHVVVHPMNSESDALEFVGSVMDISTRRQAEEMLRRSEAYLAEAQGLSKTGSWARDPVGFGIRYWSLGLYHIYGLDPRNGLPLHDTVLGRIHPEDRPKFLEMLRRLVREKTDGALDYRIVFQDGSVKHIHVVGRPIVDAAGKVVELVGTGMDVTEQHGARAALEKALDEIKVLRDQLYKENVALKEEVDQASMFEEVVGSSPALRRVLADVARVAPTDSTVLIAGETGTGKELIARAIHKRSRRSARAFVAVNCAAIPQTLIASELFGYEKGAFTGATRRRLGRFELADGGTILLDEVGELPAETQVTLLRVLQERTFERVGGDQLIPVDVRVIAATNRDLEAAVQAGAFRRDLFYRLNVFPVCVPPLRERVGDMPVLAEYFIGRFASNAGKKIRHIEKRTLELFQTYDWPGNVRELQNVIERAVILCDGNTLAVDETWLRRQSPAPRAPSKVLARPDAKQERVLIESALADSQGRISGPDGAAARLGVPRSTLESKIRTLGINKHQFKSG